MKTTLMIVLFLVVLIFSPSQTSAQYYNYPFYRSPYSYHSFYPSYYSPSAFYYSRFYYRQHWEAAREQIKKSYSKESVVDRFDSPSPVKRQEAARLLARFPKDDKVRKMLEDSLSSEPNVRVRLETTRSLGIINNTQSVPILEKISLADPVEQVQVVAKSTTRKIHFNNLVIKLGSNDKNRRLEALKIAMDFPFPNLEEVIRILGRVMLSDPAPEVRREAARVLGKIGDKSALSILNRAREKDPNKIVIEEIVVAIEKIQKNQ